MYSDYVCSSPDVDDVHREPRHTCTKKQINLRHKAAPAPGTRDYEVFVEMVSYRNSIIFQNNANVQNLSKYFFMYVLKNNLTYHQQ